MTETRTPVSGIDDLTKGAQKSSLTSAEHSYLTVGFLALRAVAKRLEDDYKDLTSVRTALSAARGGHGLFELGDDDLLRRWLRDIKEL